ncbi:T9SS type B sorting domain-containing protein [Olleya aquimaris]|uniref:Gliding motility-associated-like protein n=1 Tax=Olleya aquimaris TaxID=639310 RepID=A0A327R8D2_9FLAO|nr:choice-of-anchor L domain-containing protein [Olleya aquimaris]RAJ13180.1 gliding motility-associated-like protein [Olleya aquimaris]
MHKVFIIFLFLFLYSAVVSAQNVVTDSQTYTPQQLIEDILIDSNCITNVQVTNVVGGNFGGADQSYGYFDASGTTFPFQSGVVLSTGRLTNVNGPNSSLSDDDAPNWDGDQDLESILNESNTLNATIIEFQFTSTATQISFNYIFASEEYQEGNPNTCQYSDLFGFLIRESGQQQYENIALVPNTQTPVKVTTVHPEIPGGCQEENEFYFESWNDNTAPINFNGQTKVLSAVANTTPNATYEVKLVIADEFNYRYDSAVFLEAGSFKFTTDLGPNLLESTNNALCPNDTIQLDATQAGNNSYAWFENGVLLPTEINPILEVDSPGTYNVEVTLADGCISYGDIIIEEFTAFTTPNTTLIACDIDQDGFTQFNLFNADLDITSGDPNLSIVGFFQSQSDAEQQQNAISTPENFQNTSINQTVFALIESNQTGCTTSSEITLQISNNTLPVYNLEACDNNPIDGYTLFDLDQITTQIELLVPNNADIHYYLNEEDAFAESNPLPTIFESTEANLQTIIAQVTTNSSDCYAITEVNLNVLYTPDILEDETIEYCLNDYPETITLYGGVLNDSPSNYYYQWLHNGTDTGVNTSFIEINEIGTYTVIITDPNGCSNTRDITVVPIEAPIIDSIDFTELTTNNTVTVNVSNTLEVEYALDNTSFQPSHIFTNVAPGLHTVFVRDLEGCGQTEQTIAILGFPQYFTPNGDLYNQHWKPKGMTAQFNATLDIKIFDRFGKFLHQINPETEGWNGTLHGNPLPTNDYWYVVTRPNGQTYRGHFSLVR